MTIPSEDFTDVTLAIVEVIRVVDMYVDKVADMVIDPITRKQIKMPRNSWKQWMSIVVVELWIQQNIHLLIK